MTLMSWSAQGPRSGGEGPQRAAVGPQEFLRQSRQLGSFKALTSLFVGQSRQLRRSKAQHVVRADSRWLRGAVRRDHPCTG